VAPPNLANTARIDSLMHDGKLYLALSDAIALALENNLDIAIQRYNLNIADTDVLRAKAGANILGTPIGTVMSRLHRGRRQLREMLQDYAADRGVNRTGPAPEEQASQANGELGADRS
jgi:hypothetical protein